MEIKLAYIPEMNGLQLVVVKEQREETLSFYDWPWLAAYLGWTACERCEDIGSMEDLYRCQHRALPDMLNEAALFLVNHKGIEFEDPGYFKRK